MKMLRVLLLLLTTTLALGACGSDSVDDVGGGDPSDAPTGQGESDDSGSTGLYSAADFDTACRGIGVEGAAEYIAEDGLNHIVALEGEDPTYEAAFGILADGWEAGFEEIGSTELVVCLNRTATTEGELCEGFEDEGLEWSVQMNSGTYDVTLREALTGEVIEETSLEAPAEDCLMFSSYSEGDPNPVMEYATPNDALQKWLVDFVGSE